MSSHVVGFVPPDAKWEQYKAIWDQCKKAKIDPPREVEEFFDGEDPGDQPGKEVDIHLAVSRWNDESRDGFTVDIKRLPPNVTFVRFYNSW